MGALSGTLTEGVIGRHLWRDLCFSFMARHNVCVNGLWCGCCCLRERGQEGFIYTPNPADMLSSYRTERRPLVYPTTKQPDGPGKRASVGCEIGTLGYSLLRLLVLLVLLLFCGCCCCCLWLLHPAVIFVPSSHVTILGSSLPAVLSRPRCKD